MCLFSFSLYKIWVEPAQTDFVKIFVLIVLEQIWHIQKNRVDPAQHELYETKIGLSRLDPILANKVFSRHPHCQQVGPGK